MALKSLLICWSLSQEERIGMREINSPTERERCAYSPQLDCCTRRNPREDLSTKVSLNCAPPLFIRILMFSIQLMEQQADDAAQDTLNCIYIITNSSKQSNVIAFTV